MNPAIKIDYEPDITEVEEKPKILSEVRLIYKDKSLISEGACSCVCINDEGCCGCLIQ